MGRIFTLLAVAFACASSTAFGQQGQGGRQQSYDSVRVIEDAISGYLDGEEIKNVLTPGEFSEWPLTLKAGQVVIAEARSDAFDAALEVVDDKGKVRGSNDDRYPGDQRPLLFWKCDVAGAYSLRGRCFHDKSGGQFFLRFKVYDAVDIDADKVVEQELSKPGMFLVKVPMKAGQIKQIFFENPDPRQFISASLGASMFSNGLPNVLNLSRSLDSVIYNAVMAPVDGDYYVVAHGGGSDRKKVRVGTREITAVPLAKEGGAYTGKAAANASTLWSLSIKAGEVLETSTPELSLNSQLVIAEQSDVSKYDMRKEETNPFFPIPKDRVIEKKGPAFANLPGRARDSRITVFVALRDAKLWLASNGDGTSGKQFTLTVKPAPKDFLEANGLGSQLRIGNTDYWAFDAKLGDVMTFSSAAPGFSQYLVVRDPDLNETWKALAAPDQGSINWNMVAQKPGRYLLAVSCMGDGGGGAYSLSRKVFHAKEFSKGSPAQSDLADGETHVWKFTAKPNEPLLIRWKSSGSYSVSVRNENGAVSGLPLTRVDGATQYGILKVDKPTTFLIVLISGGGKAHYSIELNDIPGYGTGR